MLRILMLCQVQMKEWWILTSSNYKTDKQKSYMGIKIKCALCNLFNFTMLIAIWFILFLILEISFYDINFIHLLILFFVAFCIRNELCFSLKLNEFIKLKNAMPVAVTNRLRKYLSSGNRLVNGANGFLIQNDYCAVFYSYIDKVICLWDIVYNKNGEKRRYVVKEVATVYSGLTNISGFVYAYNFNLLCACFNQNTRAKDIVSGFDLPKTFYVESLVYSKKEVGFANVGFEKVAVGIGQKVNSLININVATEDEITNLPGVSVIMAKKIIKFRDTNRQFTSVDDFIKTMKIKPHFEQQIRLCLSAEPVNQRENVVRNEDDGRNLDF